MLYHSALKPAVAGQRVDRWEGPSGVKSGRIAIEYVPTDRLVPNSYNPNVHGMISFNLLLKSLAMFGFTQPIVARAGTNEIIDGEHRWRCAAILGLVHVPVVFVTLTDEEMRLATIMHNEARGNADEELLGQIDTYLAARGVDLDTALLTDL